MGVYRKKNYILPLNVPDLLLTGDQLHALVFARLNICQYIGRHMLQNHVWESNAVTNFQKHVVVNGDVTWNYLR